MYARSVWKFDWATWIPDVLQILRELISAEKMWWNFSEISISKDSSIQWLNLGILGGKHFSSHHHILYVWRYRLISFLVLSSGYADAKYWTQDCVQKHLSRFCLTIAWLLKYCAKYQLVIKIIFWIFVLELKLLQHCLFPLVDIPWEPPRDRCEKA